MADLTTTDGYQYTFNPKSVVIITDHDAVTGEAVTCVYGVGPGWLKVGEPVDGFLDRVGISANFAKLTRGNGAPIWIAGAAVASIRAPMPGQYTPTIQTLVAVGKVTQGVEEDAAAAKAEINAHGGAL